MVQRLRYSPREYGGFYLSAPKAGSSGAVDLDSTVSAPNPRLAKYAEGCRPAPSDVVQCQYAQLNPYPASPEGKRRRAARCLSAARLPVDYQRLARSRRLSPVPVMAADLHIVSASASSPRCSSAGLAVRTAVRIAVCQQGAIPANGTRQTAVSYRLPRGYSQSLPVAIGGE
jgi:hypothetical protein